MGAVTTISSILQRFNTGSGGIAAAPTVQAINLVATEITDGAITLSWTRGNGSKVMIIARQGSAVNSLPINGNGYTANAAYGSPESQIGSGNYIVYIGTGNSVTITGLTEDTVLNVRAVEFNGDLTTAGYLTDTATGNPATADTFTTEYQNVIDFANAA